MHVNTALFLYFKMKNFLMFFKTEEKHLNWITIHEHQPRTTDVFLIVALLSDQFNHDKMSEKLKLRDIKNKDSEGDRITGELFQILKDDAV